MQIIPESDFPRGKRVKSTLVPYKANKRKNDQLLSNNIKPSKKKKAEVEEFVLNIAPVDLEFGKVFNSETLRDGMVVLGCINKITDLIVKIQLPNLINCRVKLNSISDHLTNVLVQQANDGDIEALTVLQDIFKVGQFVPVKIQKLASSVQFDTVHVDGSMNPRDINEGKMHYSFVKGSTIWANIVSELDHGYELTAGVANCRIFLPFKNIDNDKKYRIGEPLYCIVHKYQTVDNMTTLTVSAKRQHLNKCQVESLNFNVLIPGTQVEFFIEENQTNGVKGKVFASYDGFIDKAYQFNLKKHFKEATAIWAYVVFIESITGIIYLTLRGLDVVSQYGELEFGDLLKAPVKRISSSGIYLDLGNNLEGFVTKKRLSTMNKDADLDLNEFIEGKYSIGSRHKCRVLRYNFMEQVYTCAVEPHIVNEKMFTIKDLKFGEKYTVRIQAIHDEGLLVKVGQIRGFIPNLHLSNIEYSENIKKTFKRNQKLVVKLLSINDKGDAYFTLKQDLIESDDCLTDINDAIKNREYIGYVIKTNSNSVIIGFYNNLIGLIGLKQLNYGNIKQLYNPQDYFFCGQIVRVWVLRQENGKLKLSLTPPSVPKPKRLKIGWKYQGRIVDKDKSNLTISIENDDGNNVLALLPEQHLSRDPKLSRFLYQSYRCGKKIFKSISIDSKIVSRREYLAAEGGRYQCYKFQKLRENQLIRTSFKRKIRKGVLVNVPIIGCKRTVFIPRKNLLLINREFKNLQEEQCILAKVKSVDYVKRKLELSARQLYFKNFKYTIRLLMSYVNDIELIRKLRKSTQYQLGTRVNCYVTAILRDKSILVRLPDDKTGLVPQHLCCTDVRKGFQFEGIILGYNPNVDRYFVSLREIDRKINPKQDGDVKIQLKSSAMVRILLITDYYVLGLLVHSKYNRQLIYLPVKLYENDRYLKRLYGGKYTILRVVILKRCKGRLFGIPVKFARHLIEMSNVKKKIVKQPRLDIDAKKKKISKEPRTEQVEEKGVKIEKVAKKKKIAKEPETEIINEQDAIETIPPQENSTEQVAEEEEEETVNVAPVLSSIDQFYSPDELKIDTINDDDIEDKPIEPAVKLSKAEWKRQEEERIRRIEQELADPTAVPQSTEQFERLLLANPNSVELWLKYIAMLISATELNKARTVGEQALEKINPTMVEEKMQIWIALLNMENLYGTKDSFDELFERAIKYNETYDIYIKVIKMLANSGKIAEMEEKIRKLRNKQKQNPKMWLEIGQIYYTLSKYREARNMQEAALKSIIDKKRQFEIILRFGIMEFQYGELEHAVQHFETILDIYSRKINMWTIYIDQLIKKKEYEMARRIFERAIRQKFPVRNMRTLYQKFILFEEQYGNEENVRKVKQIAKDYVDRINRKS